LYEISVTYFNHLILTISGAYYSFHKLFKLASQFKIYTLSLFFGMY
jgi:hypothetical protein